jgi:hypothetical protein
MQRREFLALLLGLLSPPLSKGTNPIDIGSSGLRVVEHHNELLPWLANSPKVEAWVHVDAHPDLGLPIPMAHYLTNPQQLAKLTQLTSINDYLLTAFWIRFGTIEPTTIPPLYWVSPPESRQISPGHYSFRMGWKNEIGFCTNSTHPVFCMNHPFSENFDHSIEITLIVQHQLPKLDCYLLDLDLDYFSTFNPMKTALLGMGFSINDLKELRRLLPIEKIAWQHPKQIPIPTQYQEMIAELYGSNTTQRTFGIPPADWEKAQQIIRRTQASEEDLLNSLEFWLSHPEFQHPHNTLIAHVSKFAQHLTEFPPLELGIARSVMDGFTPEYVAQTTLKTLQNIKT